jgi:hypothetical protein
MKRVPVMMAVAWTVFISSWFLPVYSGVRPFRGSGCQSFLLALEGRSGNWIRDAFSIGFGASWSPRPLTWSGFGGGTITKSVSYSWDTGCGLHHLV